MQTWLPDEYLATETGREAESILRACVHCGFCNATCPTYRVLGNELYGPRGRIYLIKAMLEGEAVTEVTRTHLDRCLTCQACETTCPSGVNYHRLLDIGRAEVERQVPRSHGSRLLRRLLLQLMPYRQRFTPLLRLGQWFRVLLPAGLQQHVPARAQRLNLPRTAPASRKVILVQGCVQPGLSPNTNLAATRVLNALGIDALTLTDEGCCGAMSYHLNAQADGLDFARRNIDSWVSQLEDGGEAIVMTATGCSNFVADYANLLRHDPDYRERAARVVGSLRDISEILLAEDLESLAVSASTRVSWHCPCTAQHGQKLDAPTRAVLGRLGF